MRSGWLKMEVEVGASEASFNSMYEIMSEFERQEQLTNTALALHQA